MRQQLTGPYAALLEKVLHTAPPTSAEEGMRVCVALLWEAFGGRWSWVGFYDKSPGADEMILVCREPKPACSPSGLHGMCGRGWRERRAFVVRDVAVLGANYVACDPRDKSELVVPLLAADGACRGVLDADSYDVGAFTLDDAFGCDALLRALGLSAGVDHAATVL